MRERERERERQTLMGERKIHWLPPVQLLTRDGTHNRGKCPDWESNP